MIVYVTGNEDAVDLGGRRLALKLQVARRVNGEGATKHRRVWLVADRDKESTSGETLWGASRAGGGVAQHDCLRALLPKHLNHFAVHVQLNRFMRLHAGDHDLAGAEGVTAVHEVHLGCKSREEERLFECGVTATNDDDLLPLEEEPIARCASANASPAKASLRL